MGPKFNDWYPYKESTERQTQDKKPCGDGGRDGSDESTK